MPKATLADIQDLGFDAAQFRAPVDWADEDGYLDRVLQAEARRLQSRVGAVYAAVDPQSDPGRFELLRRAEVRLVEAELWRRIEQFERAVQTIGRADGGTETIGSRALNNAAAAEAGAWELVGEALGVDYVAGGPAVGRIETGPWPAALR